MATLRYRKASFILSAALAASLCACSSGGAESISTNPHASETPATESPATSTETTTDTTSVDFITEPSTTTSLADTDFVRIVEGVDPQMMNADYWISEEDNEICLSPKQISQLHALVRKIEDRLKCDVSVDWAYDNGQLYVLRARPITNKTFERFK